MPLMSKAALYKKVNYFNISTYKTHRWQVLT